MRRMSARWHTILLGGSLNLSAFAMVALIAAPSTAAHGLSTGTWLAEPLTQQAEVAELVQPAPTFVPVWIRPPRQIHAAF